MFDLHNQVVWFAVYDGEEDPAAVAAAKATADAQAAADAKAAADAAAGGASKQFSQEDINRFLADDRRKHATRLQSALDEVNAIKARAQLSDSEREELDGRIQSLQNTLATKEELAKQEQTKMEKKYKEQIDALSTDKKTWQGKYTESTIIRAITDSAVVNNAYVPEQIVAMLRTNTRLIEELDAEGRPTGQLIPRVQFADADKEGKPVTLELSVDEAVKRMKDIDKYTNLFKGDGTGGIGQTSRQKNAAGELDMAAFAKNTESIVSGVRPEK